jgi:membrane protein DedA with SNARE-associated domain
MKVLRNDIPASIAWILMIGAVGYLASASFELVRRRVHFVELVLLLAIALYFIFAELVSRALKNRL